MSLWDLLKPKGRTIDYVNNMPPLQAPEMEAIQVQDDGQGGLTMTNTPTGANKPVNFLNRLENKRQGLGNTLSGLLLGKQSQPTDYADANGDVLNVGISSNPRVGGLVPDVVAGFRENANTRFNPENLSQNILDDGRNKGFAYRLGEGLGTVGRLFDSPLGRGLLTAGIVGATGGSGLEALVYGGKAGVLNQNVRGANQLYRQQLKDNYGYTDEQLNNISGYIDKDTFNNITKSNYNMMRAQNQLTIAMQKDNTSRARLILQGLNNGTITPEAASAMIQNYGITDADFQESNATRNTNINEYLAPHRANMYDNSSLVGLGNLGLKQSEHDMKLKETAAKIKALEDLTGGGNNIIPDDKKRKGRAF